MGVVNLVTGVPATPTVVFASNGTLTESAANGTIGLANLYIPLNFKNASVSSWNVAVQQALPGDMSMQIAYVANHGTRIDVAQNINLPSIYGQSAAYDPLNLAFGKTAAVTQYFLGFSTNYQSLQAQLTRRFTKGLAFTSALTWGKAQNYQPSPQDNALNFFAGPLRRNYNLADFDRTLNWEQTITYELPAGSGHPHFNSGVSSYVLGGWRVSAILSALSGLPFTITTTSATPGTTQTVNQIGSLSTSPIVSPGRATPPGSILPPSRRLRRASHTPPPIPFRAPSAIRNAISSAAPATSPTTCRSSRASPCSARPLSKPASMPSISPIPRPSICPPPHSARIWAGSPRRSAAASATSTAWEVLVSCRQG